MPLPPVRIAPTLPWEISVTPTMPNVPATTDKPWWQRWYVVVPVVLGAGYLFLKHRKASARTATS